MFRRALVPFVAATLFANSVGALDVGNAGFEEPALSDGASFTDLGAPWTFFGGSGVPFPLTENPAGAGVGVTDGDQRIRLRTGPYGSASGIQQTLSATYQAETAYVFAITAIDFDGAAIPGFQILLDGLAARTVTSEQLTGALGREISVSATVLPGDPVIGENVRISVFVFGQGLSYGAVSFDRARVWSIPIPEPSSAALTAFGLLGVGISRRVRTSRCRGPILRDKSRK